MEDQPIKLDVIIRTGNNIEIGTNIKISDSNSFGNSLELALTDMNLSKSKKFVRVFSKVKDIERKQ